MPTVGAPILTAPLPASHGPMFLSLTSGESDRPKTTPCTVNAVACGRGMSSVVRTQLTVIVTSHTTDITPDTVRYL
eukprot:1972827-Pleurochrysis_carterae.AAC.2